MPASFDRRSIASPAQIRLLSSPVRQELVDTLAALGGEADVAALAEQMGRPADGLYYHVRALVAGGLVEAIAGNDGAERRYRLAGLGDGPLRLAYDLGPDGNAAELGIFARALLQVAGHDFETGLTSGTAIVDGEHRDLWIARNKGWLSAADLAEVNALLERLSALSSQPKTSDRDKLVSLIFALAPIDPRPKRRESGHAARPREQGST